jgi:hypothetical protein
MKKEGGALCQPTCASPFAGHQRRRCRSPDAIVKPRWNKALCDPPQGASAGIRALSRSELGFSTGKIGEQFPAPSVHTRIVIT